MTATITFDTLALKDALGNQDLATKADLNAARADLKAEIEKLDLRIKAEIAPLKWITGVMAAGIISLVMKTFF